MVWACDEKRGTLSRKEDDGNESRTGEKEERKTSAKMVGQSKGRYQREGSVGCNVAYDRATWRRMYIDLT